MIKRAWLYALSLAAVTFLGGLTAEASPRAPLEAKRSSASAVPLHARGARAPAPKKAPKHTKGRALSAEPRHGNMAPVKKR
jgi:hypothetical protein